MRPLYRSQVLTLDRDVCDRELFHYECDRRDYARQSLHDQYRSHNHGRDRIHDCALNLPTQLRHHLNSYQSPKRRYQE